MRAVRPEPNRHTLPHLVWAALAALTGVLTVQPAALAAAAVALAVAITPLAALCLMLVLAPLRTLIATESPVQLPLDIGQITLILLLGAWFAHRLARRGSLPRLPHLPHLYGSPLFPPLLGFTAAAALSAFSAYAFSAWLTEWLKWIQILLLVAFALDAAHDARWHWLVFALTLAGCANALVGVYQFFGGSGALHLLVNDRYFRAFGTFGQPNPFGGFMGLLAPLALGAAIGCIQRLWAAYSMTRQLPPALLALAGFYAAAAALLALGVFLSWSRGAWLGFAAAVLVVFVALPRRPTTSAALLLAGLVGGGVLWASGRLPASITDRVNSATAELFAFNDVRGVDITGENYAVVERLAHWQAALNMARVHPFTGVGFGNYEIAYADFRLLNWKFPLGHAHNFYLNLLAETGIIGLAAYVVFWGSVVALTWRARRHPNVLARAVVVGLMGTWTYLSVHSLTDNLYVNNLFLHLGVLIGVLAVLYQQIRPDLVRGT